jgi:hypothetical protein
LVRSRRSLSGALAAVATAVALYSAWYSGGHVWRRIDAQYRAAASLTPLQRKHAPIDTLPLPSDIFDFYAAHVGRGDRIYYQVLPSGFGPSLDLPTIVGRVGDFYLLPSVRASDLRHATVVLSWYADPAQLHVHFPVQVRAGLQPIYVSRLRPR